ACALALCSHPPPAPPPGEPRQACTCTPMQIEKYLGRISGPMLDRIDLHIEVPAVPFQELSAHADGTSSAQMREQVQRARSLQRRRFGTESARLNSRMTSKQLRKFCPLEADCHDLMQNA